MSTLDRLSFIWTWICAELLDALLRPLWLTDKNEFQRVLCDTDCYPCRVSYDLGPFPQMWIETGPKDDASYWGDYLDA